MERNTQHIEQLVVNEYKAYGFEVHDPMVEERKDGTIVITINSEDPFMGLKFWEFLDSLHKKLQELGYKKKDGTFFHDFYTAEYVK